MQGPFTPADERLAASWHARGVAFETVRRAGLPGCTRKSFALIDRPSAAPIRRLAYFAPLLEEVQAGSFPPGYWDHLESAVDSFPLLNASSDRHSRPFKTPLAPASVLPATCVEACSAT